MLSVGWMGWDGMGWDGMVIIGHRSSNSTFCANKRYTCVLYGLQANNKNHLGTHHWPYLNMLRLRLKYLCSIPSNILYTKNRIPHKTNWFYPYGPYLPVECAKEETSRRWWTNHRSSGNAWGKHIWALGNTYSIPLHLDGWGNHRHLMPAVGQGQQVCSRLQCRSVFARQWCQAATTFDPDRPVAPSWLAWSTPAPLFSPHSDQLMLLRSPEIAPASAPGIECLFSENPKWTRGWETFPCWSNWAQFLVGMRKTTSELPRHLLSTPKWA